MALDKSLSVRVIGREMLTSEHLETIWASTTGLTSGFVSDLGGGVGGGVFWRGVYAIFLWLRKSCPNLLKYVRTKALARLTYFRVGFKLFRESRTPPAIDCCSDPPPLTGTRLKPKFLQSPTKGGPLPLREEWPENLKTPFYQMTTFVFYRVLCSFTNSSNMAKNTKYHIAILVTWKHFRWLLVTK